MPKAGRGLRLALHVHNELFQCLEARRFTTEAELRQLTACSGARLAAIHGCAGGRSKAAAAGAVPLRRAAGGACRSRSRERGVGRGPGGRSCDGVPAITWL